MATFIDPNITLSKAAKRKMLEYRISLDSAKPDCLVVKARNYKGRGLGTAGTISRDGSVNIHTKHLMKLSPLIHNNTTQAKISMVLDLMFGKNRVRSCEVKTMNGRNIIEFVK